MPYSYTEKKRIRKSFGNRDSGHLDLSITIYDLEYTVLARRHFSHDLGARGGNERTSSEHQQQE